MTSYIPDDILIDLLTRLPVKSLVRLRSVSKSWLSLISCTDFAKLQFKRASSAREIGFGKIMHLEHCNIIKFIDSDVLCSPDGLPESESSSRLPFFNGSFKGRILGSVNGLICVCTYEYNKFHILNPCTNQYKEIPALKYPSYMKVNKYGFGYDSTTEDYKLVIVSVLLNSHGDDDPATVNIFSLKRGTWRSFLDTEYLNKVFSKGCCGTFLNNAIHWTTYDVLPYDEVIVSFRLAEESFSIIPFPDFCEDGEHLSVLDGCLCLSSSSSTYSDSQSTLNIWMMKEYGVISSWTELINARYDYIGLYDWFPLCSTREGGILFKSTCGNLAYTDAQKKSFNIVTSYSYGFPVVYVETTLISPPVSDWKIRKYVPENMRKAA